MPMKEYSILQIVMLGAVLALQPAVGEEPNPTTLEQPPPDIPASFVMAYETSFEDVMKKDSHRLKWDLPHWFEYAAMHKEDGGKGRGEGGARMWVETNRVRTGKKSIGLEVFDVERSRRSEFVLFPDKYLGSEYYVSYWLCLPEDWGLFEPKIDWDWYEIGNPYSSAGAPYSAIYIRKPDKDQKYYTVALGGRDEKGKGFTAGEQRLVLPKGRWFNITYHVRRHKTNGTVKLWFDGKLIGEKTGFPTMHSKKTKFTVSIAKVYHECGDKVPHKLWIDDLVLYTKSRDSEQEH